MRRDPIRLTLALLGTVILLFIIGYGVTLDVEKLSYAVLDHDQSGLSQEYTLNIAGSPRYFSEQPPIADHEDLDRRMRSGELTLAIEIPPGFGRDVAHRRRVEVGAWIDGAMPQRGETVRTYVEALHRKWVADQATRRSIALPDHATIEARYRYNPDIKSLEAMVPGVIPMLLLLIQAMLTALSVVREKELGSIVNFYVTPTTRLEFLLGKQIPYLVLGLFNFLLLVGLAVTVFGIPLKGNFVTLAAAMALYLIAATAIGLLISSFMRSQIAAIFGTAVLTILPATQFTGLIDPVSSLHGIGAIIGEIHPMTHCLTVSRGVFNKGLSFSELRAAFVPLLLAGPVLLGLATALLNKQET